MGKKYSVIALQNLLYKCVEQLDLGYDREGFLSLEASLENAISTGNYYYKKLWNEGIRKNLRAGQQEVSKDHKFIAPLLQVLHFNNWADYLNAQGPFEYSYFIIYYKEDLPYVIKLAQALAELRLPALFLDLEYTSPDTQAIEGLVQAIANMLPNATALLHLGKTWGQSQWEGQIVALQQLAGRHQQMLVLEEGIFSNVPTNTLAGKIISTGAYETPEALAQFILTQKLQSASQAQQASGAQVPMPTSICYESVWFSPYKLRQPQPLSLFEWGSLQLGHQRISFTGSTQRLELQHVVRIGMAALLPNQKPQWVEVLYRKEGQLHTALFAQAPTHGQGQEPLEQSKNLYQDLLQWFRQ